MADINSGNLLRFENGGVVLIGAGNLLNIKSGTLKFSIPGYEPIAVKDRGIIGDPLAGDERECSGSLDVKYTSAIDTDGIMPLVMNTLATNKIVNRLSSGKLFTFALTVKIFQTPAATTYDMYVFNKCYLENGWDYAAAGGADVDTISLKFKDAEMSPTITTV